MKEYGIERDGKLTTREVPDGDTLIQGKLTAHGWLPVAYDPEPAYDPDTHYHQLSGLYTVEQDDITRHYEVIERAAEEKKQIADRKQKAQDIAANLPSWSQVQREIDNIGNLADARRFLKKLSRVVYWDIKNDSV